jgi:hypothetical protein
MSEPHEIIGAFLDGEPVEPERLGEALAGEDARRCLVDLLVLRGLMRSDTGAEPVVVPPPATLTRPRSWRLAAAVTLVMGAAAGYGVGWWSAVDREPPTTGPADGPTVATTVRAPEPTDIIRLEPGVDWSERTW